MANNFSQNQDEGNGPPSDRTQESRMQNNQEEGSGPPPDRTRESWTQHNQEEGNGPPSDRTQESGVQNTRYVMLASDGIENAALQQAEDMTISNSMSHRSEWRVERSVLSSRAPGPNTCLFSNRHIPYPAVLVNQVQQNPYVEENGSPTDFFYRGPSSLSERKQRLKDTICAALLLLEEDDL